MTITAHNLAIGTFVPLLHSLSHVLDKAADHARAKNLELAALVNGRLAPDMYTLRQQVQLACHHAKEAAARLAGSEPTAPEDLGATFDELKTRIRQTIESLEARPAAELAGAEEREILMPVQGGDMVFEMTGYQFLRDWALPHFYFHVVTAYDILRHLGVELGKRDYMRNVGRYIRKPNA